MYIRQILSLRPITDLEHAVRSQILFFSKPYDFFLFRKRAMKNVTSRHETKENIEMTQNVSLKAM